MSRHDIQERMEAESPRAVSPSSESSPWGYYLCLSKRQRVSLSCSPSTSNGSVVTCNFRQFQGPLKPFIPGHSQTTAYKKWLQARGYPASLPLRHISMSPLSVNRLPKSSAVYGQLEKFSVFGNSDLHDAHGDIQENLTRQKSFSIVEKMILTPSVACLACWLLCA